MALSSAGPGRFEQVRRLLLAFAGVFSALALIECPALLGIFDYSAPGLLSNLRSDPELGIINWPNSFYAGARMGGSFTLMHSLPPSEMSLYRWEVRYDRNGFRNPAGLKKADIVVTGSSLVEEQTIPDAQLMTALLAQRQRVAVANLGHNAYGPQQQLIVLKRYGLPLHPRTVVWVFSDYTDLRQATFFADDMYRGSYWHAFFHRSFTRKVYRLFGPVVQYAVEVAKNIFVKDSKPSVSLAGAIIDSNGVRRTLYFHYAEHPFGGDDLRGMDIARKTLQEAYRLCALEGSRLVVVFAPEKYRVFAGVAQFPENSETRRWALSDMPQRLAMVVASISPDIGYLDLTPMLVDAAKRGIISYYTDDSHWSPEGQRLAAEEIGRYLSQTDRRSPAADPVVRSNR